LFHVKQVLFHVKHSRYVPPTGQGLRHASLDEGDLHSQSSALPLSAVFYLDHRLFADIARVASELNMPHPASQGTSFDCHLTQCFLNGILAAR
jgi:hypothetical protein